MANRNRARIRAIKVHMFKTGMPFNEAARVVDRNDLRAGLDRYQRCWPIGTCESINVKIIDLDHDSAWWTCYHCRNLVCQLCQHAPVLRAGEVCDECAERSARGYLPYREGDLLANEQIRIGYVPRAPHVELPPRVVVPIQRPGPRPRWSPEAPF